MGELEAPYMNRKRLYVVARFFRRLFCLGDEPYLDVLDILERCIIKIDPMFNYEVAEKWEYGSDIHALCDISRHSILIREDVYTGAYKGNGRDRLTIMHEMAHYFLFTFFGCPVFRSFQHNHYKIPREKDPEWQAMNLAGLIMCPPELIKGLTVKEIAEKCGVSYSSAETVFSIKDNTVAKGGKKRRAKKRSTYKKSPW